MGVKHVLSMLEKVLGTTPKEEICMLEDTDVVILAWYG